MTPPQVAIITGASSGIGYAFAEHYAAAGYELHLIARRTLPLKATAQRLQSQHSVTVRTLSADLTTKEGLSVVLQHCHDQNPTVLINNAGIAYTDSFSSLTQDALERELQLDFTAQILLTKSVLPQMQQCRQGTIVLVSSLAALIPADNDSGYVAAKAGLNAFAESMHHQMAPSGVHIVATCPGFVRTNIYQAAGSSDPAIPRWLWSTPTSIVQNTLRRVGKGRAVILPRWHDRALHRMWTLIPRKVKGVIARRMYT